MGTVLQEYHKDFIKNAKIIVVDLSDTIINGNAAYGAFYIVGNRSKKGKFLNAIKLGVHGARIYTEGRVRRDLKEWDRENYIIGEFGQVANEFGITEEEMVRGAGRYIKMFENPGAKNALIGMKNFGEEKKITILLTREPSECAKAAMYHFGFDYCISNITKLKDDGTIDHIEIIMKNPEEKLELLQKEIEKHGVGLQETILISDNDEDPPIFKGRVGLFISYKNGKGDLNIDDYREFERQLISSN